jgi:hypothetical protein
MTKRKKEEKTAHVLKLLSVKLKESHLVRKRDHLLNLEKQDLEKWMLLGQKCVKGLQNISSFNQYCVVQEKVYCHLVEYIFLSIT